MSTTKKIDAKQTIIGLKTNCARGFGLAEFWQSTYEGTIKTCLASWKMMQEAGVTVPADLLWAEVGRFKHYKTVCSSVLGNDHKTVIRDMIIPANTYTTKKGVEKTTPEQRVPAHYTQSGQYLGRVSALGAEPTFYQVRIEITPAHFKVVTGFRGVTQIGATLEECFKVLDPGCRTAPTVAPAIKDITATERKALAGAKTA